MKIVQFNAENIKKLRAVEITPKGEIVTIAGRNGQGKSSILDSIWWALTGTSHIQEQPIRKGETKARIRLDLGEIVVERRFTESGGSSLFVDNAEGARYTSPQKMLDALLGELSFDPLAFCRMEPRKQFDELRRVAKVEVDLDKLEGLSRSDFAKRTDVNRDAKAKRAQAEGIIVPAGTPEEPVNEDALVEELQKAGEHNADIEARKTRRESALAAVAFGKQKADEKMAEAVRLRDQAAAVEAEAASLLDSAKELEDRLRGAEELPPPIDLAGVRVRIADARTVNRNVELKKTRAALIEAAEGFEAQARELTASIEARDQAKAAAIATAKMPVEGLSFGDGHVTYNGIPLAQASTAEQLRVSLGIAMAANPKIRVIRIQDGSLLDEDSMAEVAAMAKANDYQVWIERVSTDGKVGIVIEDGAVKAVAEPVVEAAE